MTWLEAEYDVAAALAVDVKAVPPNVPKAEQLNGDTLVPLPIQVVQDPGVLTEFVSVQLKFELLLPDGLAQVTVSVPVALLAVDTVPTVAAVGAPTPSEKAPKVRHL